MRKVWKIIILLRGRLDRFMDSGVPALWLVYLFLLWPIRFIAKLMSMFAMHSLQFAKIQQKRNWRGGLYMSWNIYSSILTPKLFFSTLILTNWPNILEIQKNLMGNLQRSSLNSLGFIPNLDYWLWGDILVLIERSKNNFPIGHLNLWPIYTYSRWSL